jgi:hypothetical protein
VINVIIASPMSNSGSFLALGFDRNEMEEGLRNPDKKGFLVKQVFHPYRQF